MTDTPDDRPSGKMRRVLLDAAPPKAAHMILWTRAGSQVLLEIGYFDLYSIHQQVQPDYKGEKVLDWIITDRFILDFEAAQRVVESFQQLADHLKQLREEGLNADTVP